jgi:hypothetical protein
VKTNTLHSPVSVALRAVASIGVVALVACGSDAPAGPSAPAGVATFVHLAGDPGETLGGGATLDYSATNALVTVRPFGAQLAMRVVGDRVWDGFLALASSETRLRAGTFTSLTNAPGPGSAGFRWSSQEVTCTASVATVTIDSVKYDGDVPRAIDLRFEQRCDGESAALRGTVHWRAEDDPSAPGPVLPVPPALWRAPAGSTPATGPYVYLEGSATLGPGITLPRTIVPAPGAMQVKASGNQLSILAFDPVRAQTTTANFREMSGMTSIQEGYYGDLRGLGEQSGAGSLGVTVDTWQCATLVGWFAIDRQFYFQGSLTIVDLRFELRCGGFGAPLRGQVHWAESGA